MPRAATGPENRQFYASGNHASYVVDPCPTRVASLTGSLSSVKIRIRKELGGSGARKHAGSEAQLHEARHTFWYNASWARIPWTAEYNLSFPKNRLSWCTNERKSALASTSTPRESAARKAQAGKSLVLLSEDALTVALPSLREHRTKKEGGDLSEKLRVCRRSPAVIESIPRKLPPAKKCIKDSIKIHNIKQRDGESTEEFVRRYNLECMDVKGAPECMKISGFMHGITNPELIKRLHDKIPKSVNEMMRVTTTFLRGEVAASNRKRKKSFPSWKQQEAAKKQHFKKGDFRNQQRPKRKQDRFTLLTKTPKEILALNKGKFKPPPPMTTLVEKRNASKFCEVHGEVELKQSNGKDQAKATKKGETSRKDKPLVILIVQPWQRVAKQRITQTFSPESVIYFPPLGEEDRTEGPMIIKAEM
ncbi:hypothetical protein Tco_1000283 [Tanacetum coccineum]